MELLVEDAGIPAGPVQSVEEALYNEQTEAREVVTEIEVEGVGEDGESREIPVIEHPLNYEHAESGFESAPPKLGEDNRELFREIGYSEAEIEVLADRGVFGTE